MVYWTLYQEVSAGIIFSFKIHLSPSNLSGLGGDLMLPYLTTVLI